jgi:hypothetical protein
VFPPSYHASNKSSLLNPFVIMSFSPTRYCFHHTMGMMAGTVPFTKQRKIPSVLLNCQVMEQVKSLVLLPSTSLIISIVCLVYMDDLPHVMKLPIRIRKRVQFWAAASMFQYVPVHDFNIGIMSAVLGFFFATIFKYYCAY